MKVTFFIVLLFALPTVLQAQKLSAENRQKLLTLQDSLIAKSFSRINLELEPERYNSNYAFIKTLIEALKIPGSFGFGFDSLKSISIQPSGDGAFRIFSWPILNSDGSYRYYGTIQMNKPGAELQMFPLVDYSESIKAPADTLTTNDKWYGAQYYKVIPVSRDTRIPYYILLGWKGNSAATTKKVIDILYFKDGKACFGMPVFDGDKEHPNKHRVIFEYSAQVTMLLNYQEDKELIVFDHLAPPNPALKGKFDQYGPDFTYDGLKFSAGRWRLTEDLEVKNPASAADEQYNDPRKPTKKVEKL